MESRSKILGAAIQEFGKKGYKQGSTNDICKSLQLSKGIIFYHFGSKEQLFLDSVTLCMREFDAFMQQHFIKGNTPQEGIRGCCLARKEFFSQHPEYLRIFCDVLYTNDKQSKISNAEYRRAYERHTYDILDHILEGVELNANMSREENIWMAVRLIELIDMEMANRYQDLDEEPEEKASALSEKFVEEQMRQYEGYLEALLYGILKR